MKLIIEPGLASTNYWRDIWRYRELMYFLAWRDILVRYKQTAIGVAWAVLRPALTMLVFVAFRRLVGINPGELPEPILVFAAVLPWQFFSTALIGILWQSDRERQPDLQSLFSARDHSRCCDRDGLCGLSHYSGPARSAHAVVRRRPRLAASNLAAVRAARLRPIAGPRPLPRGAERGIPRFPLHRSVHRPSSVFSSRPSHTPRQIFPNAGER